MNKMIFRKVFFIIAVVIVGSFPSLAQMPDSGGVNSALIKLFGDTLTFTAKSDVQVLTSNRVEWLRMPSSFAALDGKMRVDVDMMQLKSKAVSPATISTLKQIGMDRVSSVIRPDKKATYIIYPGAQSYASMPLSKEDIELANQKVVKTALGKETVDGHPCVKNRAVVKNSKGTVLIDAITWNATDLRDFPVQIETKEGGNISVMHFQQISFTKPDPKLFEPPAGLKQFDNPQDLMMAALKKISVGTKK